MCRLFIIESSACSITVSNKTSYKERVFNESKHNQDKFTQSGVYKLICPDCGKFYIGQTGRDFKTRLN